MPDCKTPADATPLDDLRSLTTRLRDEAAAQLPPRIISAQEVRTLRAIAARHGFAVPPVIT